MTNDCTSGALVEALVADFPEVEQAARVLQIWGWIEHGGKGFSQSICVAESAILDMLPIPLVRFGLHDFLLRHDRSAKFDMDRLHAIFSRVP